MNFRSPRVVLSAIVFAICALGYLVETLQIQGLCHEADSLVAEVHGKNFDLAVGFLECCAGILSDQPEVAVGSALTTLKGLVGQGQKLKQLEGIYIEIKADTQRQRFFAVLGVIAAAVLVLLALPFRRKSAKL